MSSLASLLGANIRVCYRSKGPLFVMLGFSAFGLAIIDILVYALAILPETRSAAPDSGKLAHYLAMIAYGTAFIAMGMNVNVFTANTMVREKAQRIHESILSTPVSTRRLWVAKSLAIFLPGFALCELMPLITMIGFDALAIAPAVGPQATGMMAFNALALIPLLYLPICFLVILIGLAGNPVSGNVLANVVFSGVLTLALNLATRGGLDMGSPSFAAGHLALSLALGALVFLLGRSLSKERIVLSARS
jgi:ABC-2 type transport system permease protein